MQNLNGWREAYKIHPATEQFPLMSPGELAELASDIKANGLKIPIQIRTCEEVEYLVDGRNRLSAFELLGGKIDESMIERKAASSHKEIWADVVSLNIRRRNLNEGQRLVIADQLAKNLPWGDPRKVTESSSHEDDSIKFREAAAMCGVSPAGLSRFRQVKKEAPHLIKDIIAGTLTVFKAGERVHKRKTNERKIKVKPVKPTIMVHENICPTDRLMAQPLERIYNSVSHNKWGLFHFLVQLDKELGRGRLRSVALRAERARLSEEKIMAKILAEQNTNT